VSCKVGQVGPKVSDIKFDYRFGKIVVERMDSKRKFVRTDIQEEENRQSKRKLNREVPEHSEGNQFVLPQYSPIHPNPSSILYMSNIMAIRAMENPSYTLIPGLPFPYPVMPQPSFYPGKEYQTPQMYHMFPGNIQNMEQEKGLTEPPLLQLEPSQYMHQPSVEVHPHRDAPFQIPEICRFCIDEEPNTKQRKSYKSENRYILPNPVVICLRSTTAELQPILAGNVSVCLVSDSVKSLPRSKQNSLSTPEGSLTKTITDHFTCEFSLKLLDTSEGMNYKLLFVVQYTTVAGKFEERIHSRAFEVFSNRKKSIRVTPALLGLKPESGNEATEVWIKGSKFTENVEVKFGTELGEIKEITENLLTVLTPRMPNITEETTVSVSVGNIYGTEVMPAKETKPFLFIPPKKT